MLDKPTTLLLEAHRRGDFDVPDVIKVRAARLDALGSAMTLAKRRMTDTDDLPVTTTGQVAKDLADTFKGGEPSVDVGAVVEAERVKAEAASRFKILSLAQGHMERRLMTLIDEQEPVICDHLTTAIVEIVDQIRPVLAVAETLPWERPEAVLRGSQKQQDAWRIVEAATKRYQAIRDVYSYLEGGNRSQTSPHLGEFRQRVSTIFSLPKDPRRRLVQIVALDLRPWAPSQADYKAAYAENRGEAVPA